ncbi:MAG TPA: hypothetical protein DCS93_13645 [Microscillaceae bacterium]|nr:hypothetical protein [Microscillaceae bacterium]
MKNMQKMAFAALALLVTLSSFTLMLDKKDLVGKWTPEKIQMGEHTETFDLNDGEERSIEFTEDGKYYKDSNKDEGGTWKMNEKGDKLTMEGGEFAGEWTVKELTKKRCTISLMRNGKEATMFLVPYKAPAKKKD